MAKNNRKVKFEQFLKDNLSYSDFINLPSLLDESRRSTTILLQNPEIGKISQLTSLILLLKKRNPSITVDALIKDFKFGSKPNQRIYKS